MSRFSSASSPVGKAKLTQAEERGIRVRFRLVAAVLAVTALVAMLVTDLWIASARAWWSRYSAATSVISGLLVVAVSGLIVEALIARRRRLDRARSVAVQAIIVYAQAERAYAVVGSADGSNALALDEVRALSGMLLSASSVLFEDPVARPFLEQVQALTGSMFRAAAAGPDTIASPHLREQLAAEMTLVKTSSAALLRQLPEEYRAPFASAA